MRITVHVAAGLPLDPRKAGTLAAPALAVLQQEIDAVLAEGVPGRSEEEIVREALHRLRERGIAALSSRPMS